MTARKQLIALFIFWPFLSLLTALKNYRYPFTKTIFILFCTYLGFTFIISEDLDGVDSARYAHALTVMYNSPVSFESFGNALYSQETNVVDIYQPLLTWVIALFTGNANILFAIFAFVFGYFYANNLWLILKRISHPIPFPLFIFLLTFMLINPIWNINGVRMWTAAQIFIYGIIHYFLEGNQKGLIWSCSAILVHFSFIFPVSLLLTFIFLPKKLMLFFIFFVFTFFISQINLLSFKNALSFLPELFQPRVTSYTNIDYATQVASEISKNSWHVKFAGLGLKWTSFAWIFLIFFKYRRSIQKNLWLNSIFCFVLFVLGWAQIISQIPSGSRFMNIGYSLCFLFLILFFLESQVLHHRIKYLKLVSLPILMFYCIFSIRVGLDYLGMSTFLGNPISALILHDATPLIKFVKSFF